MRRTEPRARASAAAPAPRAPSTAAAMASASGRIPGQTATPTTSRACPAAPWISAASLASPLTAAFLGAGYAAGFVLVVLGLRARSWAEARAAVVTVAVFAAPARRPRAGAAR